MDITKDIPPMTTSRGGSAEVMRPLRQTKGLVVLTMNRKATQSCRKLLDFCKEVPYVEV